MRTALWLLRRFGVSEPLVGDLIEQRQSGRPMTWCCRQVICALAVATARDVGSHRLLALRAVLVGAASQWLLLAALRTPVRLSLGILNLWIWNRTVAFDLDGLRVLWFGRPGQVALPVALVMSLVFAMAGWLVGWIHREGRMAMVAAFAATVPAWTVAWLRVDSNLALRLDAPAAAAAVAFTAVFLLLVCPLSVLIGGLLSPARQSTGGGVRSS